MKNKEIKEKLLKKKSDKPLTGSDYLSTGSTTLNLAITGNPNWGFAKGLYYRFVGDSASGKTWLCLTCFAEAALNPNFKDHRLIYDNVEGGALMDIRKFFGNAVAERIEPPARYKNDPVYSDTIEEFYYHIDDAVKDGRPFIYVLDSMDGLSSISERDKFAETKTAYRKGKQVSGSYGDGKAKKNSGSIRLLLGQLRKTGSILIVVSQTRDSLNMMAHGGKTSSGGHALKFYACLEIWSSVKALIERNIKGKKRQLGALCKIRVKKNRVTGRDRTIYIPIFHSYGIDDLGSCISFLLSENYWKKTNVGICATEFDFVGSAEKLIQHIEKNNLEKDLKDIVSDVWNSIEKLCTLQRKRRYD